MLLKRTPVDEQEPESEYKSSYMKVRSI